MKKKTSGILLVGVLLVLSAFALGPVRIAQASFNTCADGNISTHCWIQVTLSDPNDFLTRCWEVFAVNPGYYQGSCNYSGGTPIYKAIDSSGDTQQFNSFNNSFTTAYTYLWVCVTVGSGYGTYNGHIYINDGDAGAFPPDADDQLGQNHDQALLGVSGITYGASCVQISVAASGFYSF